MLTKSTHLKKTQLKIKSLNTLFNVIITTNNNTLLIYNVGPQHKYSSKWVIKYKNQRV